MTKNDDAVTATASATTVRERVHPIVRLDYFVRLVACPIPAIIVASSRISAGQQIPVPVWVALTLYALIWPHVAFQLARRSSDLRGREMRFLVLDAAVAGAAIALTSFQTVPSLALVTGYATILASVGGVPLLLIGVAALVSSALITAATVTDFAVNAASSPLGTMLAAVGLFGFQTMMGLLTYRTARNFVLTRRRIAEQADEISEQNEALVKAREEALQAALAKAAFLATMSHEIRTPLNGVIGMTRLLSETPLTPEQQDFVRTIQVSGTTLLTVINDILDYSRIESGRMELESEPLVVREVVEEALEIVAARARDRGIELVCDIETDVPERIIGDVTRLRQVLTNLVGNAVKFTERGEIVVSVRTAKPVRADTAELEFSVRDTGIGIPADRIGVLFTPFTQADASTTRRYGGTGLGLAISRRLTELMGGTISVRSVVGEGSTFTFAIRAGVTGEIPDDEDETLRVGSIAGRRVLVVDDNATNRRVLCADLDSLGLRAESAAGAEEALAMIEGEEPFALAILDLHMPDVDGLMLAKRIRDSSSRKLPLILLSSSLVQSKDDPERLFHARLLKPVRQAKLYEAVVRALSGRERIRSSSGAEPALAVVDAASGLRVLVADDNDINRKLAQMVLRRFGCEPLFAETGREAVDRVVEHAQSGRGLDLVFMDVHMPEMDGLEATRRIRALESERGDLQWPRIVAMTADAMPEDREKCLAAGMSDYLTKPLEFEAVRAVVADVAKHAGHREAPVAEASVAVLPATPARIEIAQAGFIDWSRLDELREYDTPDGAIVNGVIASFIDQSSEKLAILETNVRANDTEALRESAHALKGAALNIGAIVVAEQAKRIEAAAKSGAIGDVAPALTELSQAVAGTLAEIDARRSSE